MARAHDGLRPFSGGALTPGPTGGAVHRSSEGSTHCGAERLGARASASEPGDADLGLGIGWLLLILALVALVAVGALVVVIRSAHGSGANRSAIDPFTVGEPWRQLVSGAVRSQARYRELVATAPEGAIREQLLAVAGRIDDAVDECWAIAQQGSKLDRTASQMRIEVTKSQLAGLPETDDAEDSADDERRAALQARVDAHARLVATARDAENRLRLLEARLQERGAGSRALGDRRRRSRGRAGERGRLGRARARGAAVGVGGDQPHRPGVRAAS